MAGEKLLRYNDIHLCFPQQFWIDDDFTASYSSGGRWTSLATGTGAAVAIVSSGANAIGGQVKVSTGTAAAGNDSAIISTNPYFLFQAGGTSYMQALIQYSEASTNKANVFFGCSSVAAAGLMTDGAMSTASQSTVGIFKIDGGTQWNTFTSNGTTVTSNLSNATAGGTNWQWLRIECRDLDGVNMECTFFLNDQPLLSNASPNRPLVHYVAQASAADMKFVPLYMATGSGSTAENGYCDWCTCTQRRNLTGQY